MMNREQNREQKKERNWLWLLIIILIIVIILLLLRSCESDTKLNYVSSGEIVQGEIDIMTSEEIQKKVNEIVEKGMFQVFMNTRITVNENNGMDVKIQNSKNNHYDCYVLIYNGDKEIYKSGVIKPGYKLESDILHSELEDGVYDCIAYFCVLNENGDEINRIGLEIKLTKGE